MKQDGISLKARVSYEPACMFFVLIVIIIIITLRGKKGLSEAAKIHKLTRFFDNRGQKVQSMDVDKDTYRNQGI